MEIYPAGQLYNDSTEVDAIIAGNIDMTSTNIPKLTSLDPDPEYAVAPYLFDNTYQMLAFYNSDACAPLFTKLNDVGITVLGGYYNGYHLYFFTKKVINTPESWRGLNCPLGVHTSDPPCPVEELLRYCRPGDMFFHVFQGRGATIIGEDRHVLPAVWEAQKNGVLFDAASGKKSFCVQDCRSGTGRRISTGYHLNRYVRIKSILPRPRVLSPLRHVKVPDAGAGC